jgi:hypothetical protein
MNFYVYFHSAILPRDKGDIFYVGKGRGKRAQHKGGRTQRWKRIVAKYGYTVEIFAEGLTEEQAFELEMFSILVFGRTTLCNMTNGGEGASGTKHTEEWKAERSAAMMGHTYNVGRKHSEEWIAKSVAARRGRRCSQDTKAKIRAALMGKPGSCLGKPKSESHKAKLSAALMGKPGRSPSQATRDKISAVHRGKVVSQATRGRIRAAKLAGGAMKNSKTGIKGVSPHSKGGFEARVTVDSKKIYLGRRSTAEAAYYELYVPAAIKYHGDVPHGKSVQV